MSFIPADEEVHELRLGKSFEVRPEVAFHTIRYDFKPASVDTSKEASVEVASGHQVTVTIPHVEGAGSQCAVFRGNKQPVKKECALIIDHRTGTFTLEKISSKITVKKTRLDGSSKVAQHLPGRVTPVDKKSSSKSASSSKSKGGQQNSPEGDVPATTNKSTLEADDMLVGEITNSSEDEDEEKEKPKSQPDKKSSSQSSNVIKKFDVLDADLALSEDSDSS